MNENLDFYQGSKENYNPSEMQGGLYFSKDSKEILLNGGSYGNATPADEEDITAESGNLKLKDRAYDEASFSGKGYKILRKNIQEVTVPKFDLTISTGCTTDGTITINSTEIPVTTELSTPESIVDLISRLILIQSFTETTLTFSSNPTVDFSNTGVTGNVVDNSYQENRNVLLQEQINQQDTIYEIKYDFDLNNLEIKLPKNSILNFTGGSLSNGNIVVQGNISINSPLYTIFKNVAFSQPYDYSSFIDTFYDIWADNIFKSKVFRVAKSVHLTKDLSINNIKDVDQGTNLFGDVSIFGNGYTITFITSKWPRNTVPWPGGTVGFLASRKIYLENLSIITENSDQLQGFSTIFNSGQVELHNVYAFTYDRVAADWSNDGYTPDNHSYLKLNNCRLFSTSFLFEGPFDQVDIISSHLELLYKIRADFMFDILSIGAADKTHKAYARVVNSTIIGGWELVGGNEPGLFDSGLDNYQTVEFTNCKLVYFNIGWRSTQFEEAKSTKVVYNNCYIEEDFGNPIVNGIDSINYNNCYFYIINRGLYYGDCIISVYQVNSIEFLNCTIVHENKDYSTEGTTSFSYPFLRITDQGNQNCKVLFEGCLVRSELTWQLLSFTQNYNLLDNLQVKNCQLSPFGNPNIYTYTNYSLFLSSSWKGNTTYILPFSNSIVNVNTFKTRKILPLYDFTMYYTPYQNLYNFNLIKYNSQLDSVMGNTVEFNKVLEL